ncbi:hypothetical protein [Sphingomonas sp. ERG5]|uniref:hypothetical protein n=1 Tax=Sphingomonas sp. ERG5 TaxID=1381597 RepID=UPI00054C5ECE|nr:hypothetical protein [Sphingomonas sp. ERG5]
MSGGVSAAFVAGLDFIVAVYGADCPLPLRGLVTAEAGDWKLTINASDEAKSIDGRRDPLEPFTIIAENTRYFAFGVICPGGGLIGGMSEAEFIEQIEQQTKQAKEAAA